MYDIYADVDQRDLGGVTSQIRKIMNTIEGTLATGTTLALRGEVETMTQSFTRLVIGIVFAIVLVYLLMAVNFQSWLDPSVPGDAVAIRQERTQLALVRDNKIQLVPVEIGRDYGPFVEIVNGLKEGDLVVTAITDAVQPGVKVRTRESQQAATSVAQTNQEPDSGLDQYSDQSLVNTRSESTNQTVKKGQSSAGQGGSGQGGSGQQQGGKQS